MRIVRLGPDQERPPFDCEDADLNEFFHQDSREGARQLTSVTYVIYDGVEAVAFFSLSNDAIRRDSLASNVWRSLSRHITHTKRYPTQPAVKIGRLAVAHGKTGGGIGSAILNYLKSWFVTNNKTGCRFIIVDAYNTPKAIIFYL